MSMSFFIISYNKIMFGQILKELRIEYNLTQIELSKILDCSQSMITRWEKEECEPTESIIKKVAIYFNVSADYLLGITEIDGTPYKDIKNCTHICNNITNIKINN